MKKTSNIKDDWCDDISLGALISIIHRSRIIYLNHCLTGENISAAQFPYLIALMKHENISQEILSKQFQIDKGTVARNIKKLLDSGLIERKIDENNKRQYKIRLTEKGKITAKKIIKYEDKWENYISNEMETDHNELKKNLQKIASKTYYYAQKTEGEND